MLQSSSSGTTAAASAAGMRDASAGSWDSFPEEILSSYEGSWACLVPGCSLKPRLRCMFCSLKIPLAYRASQECLGPHCPWKISS